MRRTLANDRSLAAILSLSMLMAALVADFYIYAAIGTPDELRMRADNH